MAISTRIMDALTTITKSEIKYSLRNQVSSTKLSLNMARSHGLSQQFTQTEISGYNAAERLNI